MRSKSFEEPTAIGQQVSVGGIGSILHRAGRAVGAPALAHLPSIARGADGRNPDKRRPGRVAATRSVRLWFGASAAADGPEAVRAVDGLAVRRAEGDLGLLAARRAGRGEHLARSRRPRAVSATATATATVATGGIAAAGA